MLNIHILSIEWYSFQNLRDYIHKSEVERCTPSYCMIFEVIIWCKVQHTSSPES